MLNFLVTIAAGTALGMLFCRLKAPGGMLLGGILGAAILNITVDMAYMPEAGKIVAQITAGAFIGSGVSREDLLQMRHILKPAGILMTGFLITNIAVGFLIWWLTPLDLVTALFSAVPGGITDIPLIAADMGAKPVQVALLQFVRLLIGIGVYPSIVNRMYQEDSPDAAAAGKAEEPAQPTAEKEPAGQKWSAFFRTAVVAGASGLLGRYLGIPAGTLVFALFSVILLKFLTGQSGLPSWSRRVAQVLSGAYIGCTVEGSDVSELRYLLVPVVIIVILYTANFFLTGRLIHRFCKMPRKEAMLGSIPAGATDMALISMDLGINNPDLVMLQVIRLVVVVSVFPSIIGLIVGLVGAA